MNANINQFSLSGDDAEFSEIDITKYTTVQDANVTLNAASYNDLSVMNIILSFILFNNRILPNTFAA